MLNDWHDFNLAQIGEELIKLVLTRAVKNQVGAEDENTSCEDSKDIQAFKANDSVEQQEQLVDFEGSHKGKV